MNKALVHFKGTVRSAPYFVNLMAILIGIMFKNRVSLFYGLYSYGIDIFNHYLKMFFKKVIYGNTDYIPILGYGRRPDGAKNCGIFIDEQNPNAKSTSFGMPSGHSNFATLCGVFWILYVLKNADLYQYTELYKYFVVIFISCLSLSILISRYYLGCHTVQQIVLGGLIGCFMGYLGFTIYNILSLTYDNIN